MGNGDLKWSGMSTAARRTSTLVTKWRSEKMLALCWMKQETWLNRTMRRPRCWMPALPQSLAARLAGLQESQVPETGGKAGARQVYPGGRGSGRGILEQIGNSYVHKPRGDEHWAGVERDRPTGASSLSHTVAFSMHMVRDHYLCSLNEAVPEETSENFWQ